MSSTERVINLCATPPEQRSETEVEYVSKWVGANSSYFRNIRKEAIFEVVRDCRLQRFRRNELIIRQGEKGHSFYVVITGRVSVYVNTELEQAGEDDFETEATAHGDPTTSVAAGASGDEKEEAAADEFRFEGEQADDGVDGEDHRSRVLGTRVLNMGNGYAFGEIALTSLNSIRKASVICDEDTSVLVIHQNSYARSLRIYQDQEYLLINNFIECSPLFKSWRPKLRLLLRNSLRREQYGYGEPILRQGQQSGGLFFIVRGSVKLLADPTKWPAIIQPAGEEEEPSSPLQQQQAAARAAVAAAGAAAAAAGAATPALVRRRQGYWAAERRQRTRQIEVALLGEGEILGQVELLAGFGHSLTSAISTEPTSGYWLNRANCRRLLSRNRATVSQLRQTILLRLQSRSRRAPVMRRLGRDPRVAGGPAAVAAAAAAAAAAPPDPVAAGEQQRLQQQQQQADLLHTRKQPPSSDLLWQHMLAMYVEGRSQLGPVPSDPSLYYRHLCRVNADRRRHLRERAMPAQLREEDEEAEAGGGLSPHRQPRRRTVARSLKLLRRELDAPGGDPLAGLDRRRSVDDHNRLAFRPADSEKRSGAAAAASAASAATATDADTMAADGTIRSKAAYLDSAPQPRLLTDLELSRTHLRVLECRIEAFCAQRPRGIDTGRGEGGERVSEFGAGHWKGHRPHVEPLLLLPDLEVQKRRIRGSRVLVKPKQCTAGTGVVGSPQVVGHSHRTEHVVQSLPDWDQLVLRSRRERLRQLEVLAGGGRRDPDDIGE